MTRDDLLFLAALYALGVVAIIAGLEALRHIRRPHVDLPCDEPPPDHDEWRASRRMSDEATQRILALRAAQRGNGRRP